jgi:hypothetical protein
MYGVLSRYPVSSPNHNSTLANRGRKVSNKSPDKNSNKTTPGGKNIFCNMFVISNSISDLKNSYPVKVIRMQLQIDGIASNGIDRYSFNPWFDCKRVTNP